MGTKANHKKSIEMLFKRINKPYNKKKERKIVNQKRRNSIILSLSKRKKPRKKRIKRTTVKQRRKRAIYARKYMKNKLSNNLEFRLLHNMRSRLYRAFRQVYKRGKTIEILGCSIVELKCHLSASFQTGMTWDNYGKWEVDHIIPLSSAKNSDDLNKLCHYSNLQPLWKSDNVRKSNLIL